MAKNGIPAHMKRFERTAVKMRERLARAESLVLLFGACDGLPFDAIWPRIERMRERFTQVWHARLHAAVLNN